MTSGVHNLCGIASMVPQTVPNQIWDVFAAKMNSVRNFPHTV